ncbi:MAG: hypothetical protein IPG45_36870 [Deltaproteobacteria bacterium]|nr:hypothetical protein [Deltaproteobacteria bacterium]
MRRTVWVLLLLPWACAKVAPKLDCESFRAAQAQLDEVSQATLDPNLGHPRYGPVAVAFEGVAADCQQYVEAQSTARTIREAMARYRGPPSPTELAPAAANPAAPPKDVEVITAYLRAYDEVRPQGRPGIGGELRSPEALQPALDDCRRAAQAYGALDPPDDCEDLHEGTQAALDQECRVLAELQAALAAKDTSQQASFQARLDALKTEGVRIQGLRAARCVAP